jgi:hypothetical protein
MCLYAQEVRKRERKECMYNRERKEEEMYKSGLWHTKSIQVYIHT